MFNPSSWLSRVSEKHPKDRKWVRLWHVGPDRITRFHGNSIHRDLSLSGVYFAPRFKNISEWARWSSRGQYKNLFLTEVRAPTWILEEAEKKIREAVNVSGVENWPIDDNEVFIPEPLLKYLEIVKSEMHPTNELKDINKPPAGQLHKYNPPWPRRELPNPIERTPNLKRQTPDWKVPWADPEWLAKHPYEKPEYEIDDKRWRGWGRPNRYHGRKNKGYL